jgi:hypothetical protein
MRALLALLLAGCTQVERTTVIAPPSAFEIQGQFSAQWVGAGEFAAALLSSDAIGFGAYPCRPPGSADEIGGSYEYDDSTGAILAELKSLDGVSRIAISGRFLSANEMRGSYAISISGSPCNGGVLVLAR